MAEILNIGTSALLSTQRVLATIGHNIANANTPGYSKQRVELAPRTPQPLGNVIYGRGVEIRNVERVVNQFLDEQVHSATTNHAEAGAFHELAAQLNNLLADAQTGMSPALTDLFNGLQTLADHPSSIPSRQALLGDANTLINRFHDQVARYDDVNTAINQRIEESVDRINELAQSIATLNRDIVRLQGQVSVGGANDLLDQRDLLLNELSKLVNTRTFTQDDGAVNVLVGNGQTLVVGGTSMTLSTVNNPLDASRTEVAYTVGGVTAIISDSLSGGVIGGTLNFREDLLEPTRNSLGRLAVVLAQTFNAQHREGMDLDGSLGGNFFNVPTPSVGAAAGNTGTITVAFDPNNVGNLTWSDYQLTHNGTDFTLTRLSDNTTQTLSGAGPFNVAGVTITVGAAPAAGDTYLIQPTRNGARDISLALSDVRKIAAAAPVRSRALLTNGSDARISAPEVLDVTDGNLLNTVTIVFNNPPTTYQINGAGPLLPFSSGANIDVNGWRVQVTGTPRAGDQFVVEPNNGGIGDNTNARLLAGLQSTRILDGGTATYQEAYGSLVAEVGSQTHQSEVSKAALKTLMEHAVNSREQVSGVNLDEEAADLLRFQQAYQAAAQVIATGNAVFQELINAVRG